MDIPITSGCQGGAGFLTLNDGVYASGDPYAYELVGPGGYVRTGNFTTDDLPLTFNALANGTYTVRIAPLDDTQVTINCASNPLVLVQLQLIQPTAQVPSGTVFILVEGGQDTRTIQIPGLTTAPVVMTVQPLGWKYEQASIAPGDYVATITDGSNPAQTLEVPFTIDPLPDPVSGCTDEYADTYDPEATESDPAACTYSVRWRSAWQPMEVVVPAVVGQVKAYVEAELRIGFRPGHLLADFRPLGEPLLLRATVGPDGKARFRLGPYLRSAIGAPDGRGGYRLDLNSPTAYTTDMFAGYELRRAGTGQLLQHGYAQNSAVPDADLSDLLSPFAPRFPIWPGFDEYVISTQRVSLGLRYGNMVGQYVSEFDTVSLPCPLYPLPVAWLAPGGGFGFWVFGGRAPLTDEVGESQAYNEAESGERRYSQRGESRRTITAYSGVFRGTDLMDGLRTLSASPQVWYQPVVGGPWVAVTLEGGSFPAGRRGVLRQEVTISFSEARSRWAQGQ